MKDIERIVESVLAQFTPAVSDKGQCAGTVPAEVSARHVHLDSAALEQLFGRDYKLTPKRPLSQPGQFLSEERVKLVTAKGEIANVAVLGPVRPHVQVELSFTDSKQLGIDPPLRLSGDLSGAADVVIIGPKGVYEAKGSVIAAKAHVHMTRQDAEKFRVSDGEHVCARLEGPRSVTLNDVIVRVTDTSALALHIDYDEANAAMFSGSGSAIITKCARTQTEQPCTPICIPEKKSDGSGRKRLITEEAARAMAAEGLEPSAGDLLTPAAKDIFTMAARERNGKRGSL